MAAGRRNLVPVIPLYCGAFHFQNTEILGKDAFPHASGVLEMPRGSAVPFSRMVDKKIKIKLKLTHTNKKYFPYCSPI